MSFIHVPFCSGYYFMDEKRCISVPRTLSQIGAININTQQVWTQMVNISTRCCGKMNVSRKCVENVLFPSAVVRTRGTCASVCTFPQ